MTTGSLPITAIAMNMQELSHLDGLLKHIQNSSPDSQNFEVSDFNQKASVLLSSICLEKWRKYLEPQPL
jgi:hypothetical protein